MRQTSLLIGWIVCIAVFLIGCQANDGASKTNTASTRLTNTAADAEEAASTELSKVSISEAKGFGFLNSQFFAQYEDEETLELFAGVISSAVRYQGIVDLIEPEYDLEVVYNDGNTHGYHLWVGESGQKSTLMKVDDTHTIYAIPAGLTDKLINVIK